MKRKTVSALVFVFALSGFAIFASYYLKFQTSLLSKAATPDVPPQNVQVSDVSGSSFVVSWLTSRPTTGKVFYGTENKVEGAVLAVSSEEVISTHLLKISNLKPLSKYYFFICSGDDCTPKKLYGVLGGDVFQGTGIGFEVLTLGNLAMEGIPQPVFGQISLSGTDQAINSLLISAQVQGEKGMSKAIVTNSLLTEGLAKFSFELSNLRTEDGSSFYPINMQSDTLILKAFWTLGGKVQQKEFSLPVSQASPVVDTIKL